MYQCVRFYFVKCCWIFYCLFISIQPLSASQPNVLFVIADDMNGYGFHHTYPGVKTPHLDRFRASALTFELGYCNAPACVPSRASVFSGRYPFNTGNYLNGCKPWTQAPLTENESMPETFKRNGYTTFGMGKLFHDKPEPKRAQAMWDNKVYGGGFGPFADEDHQDMGKFWGIQAFPDQDFPDVRNGDAFIDFFKEKHEKPFFAVYGLWRPHTPFTAPQRFYDMYDPDPNALPIPIPSWQENDLDDVPPLGKKLAAVWGERYSQCAGHDDHTMWRRYIHAYCACTSFADWSVGRVLEALEQSAYGDNTIVIFWSDNGYHCGEKNHWEKSTLWEQAAATPIAIRVPGMTKPNSISPRPVSAIDFFPTLVDLCQLSPPHTHTLDGQSLRPLLLNPEAPWNRPAITVFEENYFSVRDERYRYIRYSDGTEELYDHQVDPHEFNNLADHPELQEIKRRLRQWIPQTWAPSHGGRWG